jgi:hypothetical protein
MELIGSVAVRGIEAKVSRRWKYKLVSLATAFLPPHPKEPCYFIERLIERKLMAATPAQLLEFLAYCMDFAQTMLRDSVAFGPFGSVLSPEER